MSVDLLGLGFLRIRKDSLIYRALRNTKKCLDWFILPDSAAILQSSFKKARDDIYSFVKDAQLVLDVGSGNRPVSRFKKVITMDFDPLCKVDVLADAHYMPFGKDVFGFVWIGGVLEHIRNPRVVIEETHRIINKGGYIYIEIPFFQRVHDAPCDFQRFTISGLEMLCNQFVKIKSGILSGPSSAFAHILRTYLALCLSFNNKNLYHFFYYYILGWVTLPIKFFDIIFSKYKNADTISFAFYYLGKKA